MPLPRRPSLNTTAEPRAKRDHSGSSSCSVDSSSESCSQNAATPRIFQALNKFVTGYFFPIYFKCNETLVYIAANKLRYKQLLYNDLVLHRIVMIKVSGLAFKILDLRAMAPVHAR